MPTALLFGNLLKENSKPNKLSAHQQICYEVTCIHFYLRILLKCGQVMERSLHYVSLILAFNSNRLMHGSCHVKCCHGCLQNLIRKNLSEREIFPPMFWCLLSKNCFMFVVFWLQLVFAPPIPEGYLTSTTIEFA